MTASFGSGERATNPLLAPVIPAKAGIQTISDKTVTRNQVRIASDKSLPPLWGKARMGVTRASAVLRAANETTMNQSITPGEILSEEYLKPMGISESDAARAVGVSPRVIREIVDGERAISPRMSARFAAFFGQSPEFWRGVQTECDSRQTAACAGSAGVPPAKPPRLRASPPS